MYLMVGSNRILWNLSIRVQSRFINPNLGVVQLKWGNLNLRCTLEQIFLYIGSLFPTD